MARKQDEITRAIVAGLDIAREYESLGVEIVGHTPDGDGWLACRAFGRDDRDPSAGICLTDGVYKDQGGDGANLTLWDFAVEKAGQFATWQEAKRHYADKAGVKLPGRSKAKPDDHLTWLPWSRPLVELWCACHKQGISPEAIEAFGGRLAKYRDIYTTIALPVYPYDGSAESSPCGWVLCNVSGGELPVFHRGKDGEPATITWEKMKTTAGSTSGWIGLHALQHMASADVVWKTEGPGDALALFTAIHTGRADKNVVLTNSGGANEHPAAGAVARFKGLKVRVVHDCDEPGQTGAMGIPEKNKVGWAPAIAREAADCRNVLLPYPIEPKHGKDLRDWLNEGHTYNELQALADASATLAATPLMPDEEPDDPHRLARSYISRHAVDRDSGLAKMSFWREELHRWNHGAWKPISESKIRASLCKATKQEFDRLNLAEQVESTTATRARKVSTGLIANVLLALRGEVSLDDDLDAPLWIDGRGEWPADEIFATSSGLLHLPSFVNEEAVYIAKPTPNFFSPTTVNYPFVENPPEPINWINFLRVLWPNDQESIDTLQQWFGYCLLPDTRHHKLLMIQGPKRSGKGTIARVLSKLVGEDNVAGPTLSSLQTNFGLWPLIGKTLAVVPDARLDHRNDTAAIVERLLAITGEDAQTIDRKNLAPITLRLKSRFVILSNDLPDLKDASGAVISRALLLQTKESFLGRENKNLERQLIPELPAILHWAIGGWQRLRDQGAFTEPKSSREAFEELVRESSPVKAFVDDMCLTGDHRETPCDDVYERWVEWCKKNRKKDCGPASLGRNLHSVVPGLKRIRKRISGGTDWWYSGLAMQGIMFS